MTGPIGAHLPLMLSNFLLNQTGLALDRFICMIMSNNSLITLSRLILQTAVIYHQGLSIKYEAYAHAMPHHSRRAVAESCHDQQSSELTLIFLFV